MSRRTSVYESPLPRVVALSRPSTAGQVYQSPLPRHVTGSNSVVRPQAVYGVPKAAPSSLSPSRLQQIPGSAPADARRTLKEFDELARQSPMPKVIAQKLVQGSGSGAAADSSESMRPPPRRSAQSAVAAGADGGASTNSSTSTSTSDVLQAAKAVAAMKNELSKGVDEEKKVSKTPQVDNSETKSLTESNPPAAQTKQDSVKEGSPMKRSQASKTPSKKDEGAQKENSTPSHMLSPKKRSGKCVQIEHWWVRRVSGKDEICNYPAVCVIGVRPGEDGPTEQIWRSNAVTEQINPRKVLTFSGTEYVLVGESSETKMKEEGWDDRTIQKFKCGFQRNFKEILKRAVEKMKVSEVRVAKHAKKKGSSQQSVEDAEAAPAASVSVPAPQQSRKKSAPSKVADLDEGGDVKKEESRQPRASNKRKSQPSSISEVAQSKMARTAKGSSRTGSKQGTQKAQTSTSSASTITSRSAKPTREADVAKKAASSKSGKPKAAAKKAVKTKEPTSKKSKKSSTVKPAAAKTKPAAAKKVAKKTPPVVQAPPVSESSVERTRSGRLRVPPLAFWRGQRLVKDAGGNIKTYVQGSQNSLGYYQGSSAGQFEVNATQFEELVANAKSHTQSDEKREKAQKKVPKAEQTKDASGSSGADGKAEANRVVAAPVVKRSKPVARRLMDDSMMIEAAETPSSQRSKRSRSGAYDLSDDSDNGTDLF